MLSEDDIRKRIAGIRAEPKATNLNQLLNTLAIEVLLVVLEESIEYEERECLTLLDDIINRGIREYAEL